MDGYLIDSGSYQVTIAGGQTITGQITFVADGVAGHNAIKVVGNPAPVIQQLIECFDAVGNPIFTVANAGGAAILGDRLSAFRPGDIFNPDWQTLTASGDNIAANAAGIRLGHGTSQGCGVFLGNGVPGAANPVTSGVPPNGSIYFRLDGVAAGTRIYHVEAGAWVGIV